MRRTYWLPLVLLASLASAQQSLQDFATTVVEAQKDGQWEKLKGEFLPGAIPARRDFAGFPRWHAGVMPAAPLAQEAREDRDAVAWVVFWQVQGPESEGDHLFPIVKRAGGWAIGKEIPEDIAMPYTVEKQTLDVRIDPATQIVNVSDSFGVKALGKRGDSPLLMRLSSSYRVTEAEIGGGAATICDSSDGVARTAPSGPVLVRCGSVMWLRGKLTEVKLRYSGKLAGGSERAGPDAAFLSAYWWPSIGRLPHKQETTLHVPGNWTAIAQGEMVREKRTDTEYEVTWRDDLAVCCHSVAAGPFVVAAQATDRGRTFRSYMMPGKVDEERAKRIVDDIKRACAFYEDRLGQFPYSHYYVIDSPGFYGLEAYSFTILAPSITSWAPTHELGHTWFGGVVPNTYLHSIWNEGLTQYIDSALFKKGSDGSLRSGQGAYTCALSEIAPVSHPATGEGYMRGTFTMSMLADEMGLDKLVKCLHRFCADRRGKASDWSDLQEAVRKETGGHAYDWFFRQWVYGPKKPTLSIVAAKPGAKPDEWVVTVEQDPKEPYRLTFAIELANATQSTRTLVTMTKRREEFVAKGSKAPDEVRVVTRDITLAKAPEPYSLKGP